MSCYTKARASLSNGANCFCEQFKTFREPCIAAVAFSFCDPAALISNALPAFGNSKHGAFQFRGKWAMAHVGQVPNSSQCRSISASRSRCDCPGLIARFQGKRAFGGVPCPIRKAPGERCSFPARPLCAQHASGRSLEHFPLYLGHMAYPACLK